MTINELNDLFTNFVSSQLFDCFEADQEIGHKTFIYLSGADDFRNEIIKMLKKEEVQDE